MPKKKFFTIHQGLVKIGGRFMFSQKDEYKVQLVDKPLVVERQTLEKITQK